MRIDVSKLLEHLNPAQREAVEHRGTPLMVLAGAGSGKTRVLTHRVAHLIATGDAEPRNILAVTFTNKAAKEMKERIWALLGNSHRELWVGTFHATCARILRGHGHLLGFDLNFSILDEGDQLALAKECCRELNLDTNRFPPSLLLRHVSNAKQNFIDPEEYMAQWAGDYLKGRVARFYALYQEKLKRSQAMDFDDLLFFVLKLFLEHREVLDLYRRRWRHVLVDEFQDTNQIQYRMVKLLAEEHRQICVVGDDDQSIYSWRGADPGNILRFDRDFPEVRIVRLEQNYRSTRNIIRASSSLISKNRMRKGKDLWTANEPGEMVSVYLAKDEREEARFVAREVRDLLLGQKVPPEEIAIFYRTHAQSRVLEEELMASKVPFAIYGGLGFYERKEVKDLVAYLRAVANEADELSWKRIINVPKRGIGAKTVQMVEKMAREKSIPFSQALRLWTREQRGGSSARVQGFIQFMDQLREVLREQGIAAALREAMVRSGYLDELRKSDEEKAQEREENLEALLNMAVEHELAEGKGEVQGFLEKVSLMSDLDMADPNHGRVSLMTLHSAKGLEFQVVFIVGMEEGLLPHSSSLKDLPSLEEERRLCYVGMTRAKRRLYLCVAGERRIWGVLQPMTPSRFISELPSQCLELTGQVSFEDGFCPDKDTMVGRWVRHEVFGAGTVVKVEAGGERLVVHFPGVGAKRFVTREAPLKWL
jgi:DNA helicase-2/ATP-dependent DNA helicase PcrA